MHHASCCSTDASQPLLAVKLTLLFPALSRNIKAHWNRNIHTLIYSALKVPQPPCPHAQTLMDIDPQVFETCSTRLKQETVTVRPPYLAMFDFQ